MLQFVSDTIYIGSIAVTDNDSLIIIVNNVVSPSNAGYTDFNVKTAVSEGVPISIASLPRINVLQVVPIILVHVNNENGIPAPPYGIGSSVTISGIITADYNSTRTDVYVQDATAGINLYSPTRYFNYQIGDSVTVTGSILQFRGLTEISPDPVLYFTHSQ